MFYKKIIRKVLSNAMVVSVRVWCYNLVEKYTDSFYLRKQFKKKNGYALDLKNPKTFREKVCWKMVNDRNPLLPIVSDKYLVYYYVASKIGIENANNLLVENYNYITTLEDLDKIEFPDSFILKSNQGSGRNFICRKGEDVDVELLKKYVHNWLNSYKDLLSPQWAYKRIKKVIIVQKLLEGSAASPIVEFKLYMLHGKCSLIHFISDRFGDREKYFLDQNFEILPSSNVKINVYVKSLIDKHKNNMYELAYDLSEDFDFIRVDFMIHDGILYLGELTNYPGSIFHKGIPDSVNQKMGEEWKLNSNYWIRNRVER